MACQIFFISIVLLLREKNKRSSISGLVLFLVEPKGNAQFMGNMANPLTPSKVEWNRLWVFIFGHSPSYKMRQLFHVSQS